MRECELHVIGTVLALVAQLHIFNAHKLHAHSLLLLSRKHCRFIHRVLAHPRKVELTQKIEHAEHIVGSALRLKLLHRRLPAGAAASASTYGGIATVGVFHLIYLIVLALVRRLHIVQRPQPLLGNGAGERVAHTIHAISPRHRAGSERSAIHIAIVAQTERSRCGMLPYQSPVINYLIVQVFVGKLGSASTLRQHHCHHHHRQKSNPQRAFKQNIF